MSSRARPTAPASRTVIVLASLIGAMTLMSGFLLLLEPSPTRAGAMVSLSRQGEAAEIGGLGGGSAAARGGGWSAIVIHGSGHSQGSVARLTDEHVRAGFSGLGFHFVIGNGQGAMDGNIEFSTRWLEQVAGVSAAWSGPQKRVIDVCLVGDLANEGPTAAQMTQLVWLTRELQRRFGIPVDQVFLSPAIAGSAGGGAITGQFPANEFRRQLMAQAQ